MLTRTINNIVIWLTSFKSVNIIFTLIFFIIAILTAPMVIPANTLLNNFLIYNFLIIALYTLKTMYYEYLAFWVVTERYRIIFNNIKPFINHHSIDSKELLKYYLTDDKNFIKLSEQTVSLNLGNGTTFNVKRQVLKGLKIYSEKIKELSTMRAPDEINNTKIQNNAFNALKIKSIIQLESFVLMTSPAYVIWLMFKTENITAELLLMGMALLGLVKFGMSLHNTLYVKSSVKIDEMNESLRYAHKLNDFNIKLVKFLDAYKLKNVISLYQKAIFIDTINGNPTEEYSGYLALLIENSPDEQVTDNQI